MKTDVQTYEPADAAARQISHGAKEINEREGTDDAARAAHNISQWTSYLPPDCIKEMIAMGWHRTT